MMGIVKRDLVQTGIQWIGETPPSWKVKSLKRNTYIKARVGWKGLTSDEFEIDSYAYLVTGSDFKAKRIELRNCYQVDEKRYLDDPFIQLEDGDVLVTKDGSIGKVAVVDGLDKPACLNSGVFVVRPTQDYISEFLYWVLTSKVFTEFINLNSSGSTIQHLYQNVFQDFSFAFPGKEQQRQIVEYLDRETAQIDALIEKQQQLIETLAERRKAVITRAVTRGLDPTVPMKDSGYRWLGTVPLSWRVIPIKRAATTGAGSGFPVDLQGVEDEEITFLKVNSLSRASAKGMITSRDDTVSHATARALNAKIFSAGSIVLAKIGAALLLGRIRMVGQDSCIDNNMMAISPMPDTDGRFLFYALNLIEFDFIVNPGTIPSTSEGAVGKFHLAFPSYLEQVEIASYLDMATEAIDNLVSKAGRVVEVLKERRQALISSAVTGKIDVRGKA